MTYDRGENNDYKKNYKTGEVKVGKMQRDTLVGYIQDKIRLSDKFEICLLYTSPSPRDS